MRLLVQRSPTTRPASSTAIEPTCARSSWKTRSRSARISSCARATVACASSSAFAWRSRRSWSAVARASSMILFAFVAGAGELLAVFLLELLGLLAGGLGALHLSLDLLPALLEHLC